MVEELREQNRFLRAELERKDALELAEIKKLVDLADEDSRGEIIPRPEDLPRLEEVLEEKLRETERKMKELSAFREELLRYRQRLEQEDES